LVLVPRDQLGEHPGKRIDLMAAELGSGEEMGSPVAQDTLEPEHEREVDLPLRGWRSPATLDLRDRSVEGATPCLSPCESNDRIFVRTEDRSNQFVGSHRRNTRMPDRFVPAVNSGAPPGDEVVRRAAEQLPCSFLAYPTGRACNNTCEAAS
jgi:hypothetical protein